MAAPDWEAIESAYRAGLLSIREIASQHGITHGAINKRAKRDGWERDLKAKIKARADALVSKREVSSKVSTETATSKRILIEVNRVKEGTATITAKARSYTATTAITVTAP